MSDSRDRAIVLVGPTHPYSGGIAQHTTRLALELEARGYSVVVESWKAQYPKALYPGPVQVPHNQPEVGIASQVIEKMTWYNPVTWWVAGRRSRRARVVGLSIPTPFHAVPYLVFITARGTPDTTVGIVHNVLPHEPGPLDRLLMRWLLRTLGRTIVHGNAAVEMVIGLGIAHERILATPLPSPWPERERTEPPVTRASDSPVQLLFFGTVRPYKGLDILLHALSRTSNIELTIAGEFWAGREEYLRLIDRLGLGSRVKVRDGYVATSDFSEIFSGADVLVLPYRSGTGSIVRELAFRFGLPVIATDVGSIAEGVVDGVHGRVVAPNDVSALADALKQCQEPKNLSDWKTAVNARGAHQAQLWEKYTQAIVGGKP